jgi:hypothetical protein
MLKAEIGDYLYYIIFAIVMIIGAIDKMQKAKRQQQANSPRVPQANDDFDDIEEGQRQTAPPQTMEDLMRRMLQTVETPKPESTEDVFRSNTYREAVSLEAAGRDNIRYIPIAVEEETVKDDDHEVEVEFKFDIRQAVIANEILNRKY